MRGDFTQLHVRAFKWQTLRTGGEIAGDGQDGIESGEILELYKFSPGIHRAVE